MALIQAEPVPWLGGGRGGDPGVAVSFGVSVVVLVVVASRREADGEVGVSPHHEDAKAQQTINASPSVRGEQAIKGMKSLVWVTNGPTGLLTSILHQ